MKPPGIVRTGVLLRSFTKIAAAHGSCQVTTRPTVGGAFRFERLDFADQLTTGEDEISKRWLIEKYLIGGNGYLPSQIPISRPIISSALDLVVFVRYIGPEVDGEVFGAQASGEVVR